MSQLNVRDSEVKLLALWEQDEFAKSVHQAIEEVSVELRDISLKVRLFSHIHRLNTLTIQVEGSEKTVGL